MDKQAKFIQLNDEIDALEAWVVDHPNADYFAKMEVVAKWLNKTNERRELVTSQPVRLTNEFKN